jgi:hypothetical protein
LLCSFAGRKENNIKRDEKKAIKIFPNKGIGAKSHSGELM